jgi:DNA-directed RNA polymerase specialized sigma subunit
VAKRKKNYLNNKDLYNAIVESKEQDKLTPTAEKMLMLLAERAINKLTYVSEDDRMDCLQFAMLDLLKYWRNFNPKYTNAFAYFTEIAKRGYAKGWNKIHPQKYKNTMSMDRISTKDSTGEGGMFNI